MRILLISLALLAGVVAGVATAGVSATMELRARESSAVVGMRAFVSRCIPGIASGEGIVTTGLRQTSAETRAAVLKGRKGGVWVSSEYEMLLIAFEDAPVCRVMIPVVDPAVVSDLVLGVFREQEGLFRLERFNFGELGGMNAVYSSKDNERRLVIRISTGTGEGGSGFALLSVERTL